MMLEDLPENTVDDGSLLAYATVMNMGVTGTFPPTLCVCRKKTLLAAPLE